MDSHALLRPRSAIRGRNDYIGHHVQAPRHIQHRHRPVHRLAISAMGNKTFLESVCRHHTHKTLVDTVDAVDHSIRFGRYRIHHSCAFVLPAHPCSLLDCRLHLRHPRHSCRRLLHAGSDRTRTITLRRHPLHILPYSHRRRPGTSGSARRSHRKQLGTGTAEYKRQRKSCCRMECTCT